MYALFAGAALGCAGGGLSAEDEAIAGRALGYLESTDGEMGADVLMAVGIYGALTGDPRADAVIEAREPRLRASERERYGVLLTMAKPAFDDADVEALAPPADTPDLEAVDDRLQGCVDAMLRCEVSDECVEFATAPSWGLVLTHQAVWLVLARWLECALPIDADALRRELASRLVAEARFDPVPSDLFFERLAMLGHLGYGRAIEPGWADALRGAQQAEGCFPVDAEHRCHPHPTGVALWALAHASRAGR